MPLQVGPYEVQSEIARGALGVVYRARDPRTGRPVALKLLLASRRDGVGRRRFEREVATLLRLRHPHLVPLIAAGEQQDCPWLALELIEGGTLQERLDREGPLPPAQAAELVRKLALALHACHREGVVHRDVKPENVLLDLLGEPRLSDFGLAQLLDPGASRLTASGVAAGTPGYWAPEQAFAERAQSGPRTDVFGLGATLYALLTGGPPHAGEGLAQVLASLERPPAPPSARRPGIPPALDAIALRCLARAPEERYPTAAALAEDLARALRGQAVSRPGTAAARRRSGLALLLLAGAVAVGLSAWRVAGRLVSFGPAEAPGEVPCVCERWSAGLEELGVPPLPAPATTIELDAQQLLAAGGLVRLPPDARRPGETVRVRVRPGRIAWSDPRPLSLEDDDVLLDLTGVTIEAAGLARGEEGLGLLLLQRKRVEVRGGELVGFLRGAHVDRCEGVRLDGLSVTAGDPTSSREDSYGVRADRCSRLGLHGVGVRGARAAILLDRCHLSRVQHCDLRGAAGPDALGLAVSQSHDCALLDNVVAGRHGGVVVFRGAAGNLIAWNAAAGCGAGVTLAEGGRGEEAPAPNLVAWNDLSGSRLMSVSGHECGPVRLHGNALSGGRQAGWLRGAPEVQLVGNLLAGNATSGLSMERVARASLRANRVRGNGGSGVAFTWPAGEAPAGGARLELQGNDFSEPDAAHVTIEAGSVDAHENRFQGGPALSLRGEARLARMSHNDIALPLPAEDLARGASVVSSLTMLGLDKAVDGDLWSEWDASERTFHPGDWVLLDLGRVTPVGSVLLVPWRGNTNDFPHRYELDGSLTGDVSGSDWVRLSQREEGENRRWHVHSFAPRPLRFLRLVAREERQWVRLQEWLVFADPAAAERYLEPWLELAQDQPVAPGPDWFGQPAPPAWLTGRVRLLPPALGLDGAMEDERPALERLVRTAPPLAMPPAPPRLAPEEPEPLGARRLPARPGWWLRRALALGVGPPPDPDGERGALLRSPLLITQLELDPSRAQITARLECPGAATPEEAVAALRPLGAFPWRLTSGGRLLASGRWLPDGAGPLELTVRPSALLDPEATLELELPGVDRLGFRPASRPVRVLVERALWEAWSALPWSPGVELRLHLPPQVRLERLRPWPGSEPEAPAGGRLLFLCSPGGGAAAPSGAQVHELPGAPGDEAFTRALQAALE